MSAKQGWSYRELVKTYFHHSELQSEWAWELLSRSLFKGDEKILDFGSGDGKITALISRLVPNGKVTGLEISEEMLKFAQVKFPLSTYSNLSFQSQMAQDDEYDLIASFSVFHLVPNPEDLLRQFKKQLTQNGKVILSIPMKGNPYILEAALDVSKKYGFVIPGPAKVVNHPTMHTIDGCKAIFDRAGYKVVKMDLVEHPTVFIDKEEFCHWMMGTLSAIWNIPWERSLSFFSDLAERLFELDPAMIDSQGVIYFPSGRLHIIAH